MDRTDRDRDIAKRAWEAALDDMADRLTAGWQALAEGRTEIRPFEPPAGLGPLPLDLRPRAETVLEETRAFETALTQRSEAVARSLLTARRGDDAAPPRASFIDTAL